MFRTAKLSALMKTLHFEVGRVVPQSVPLTDLWNTNVGSSQLSADLFSSQNPVFRTLELPNQQTHGDNVAGLFLRGSGSSCVFYTMRGRRSRGAGDVVWPPPIRSKRQKILCCSQESRA